MSDKKLYNEKFAQIYNGLNTQQKLAVDNIEGPVMVIAGPGTARPKYLVHA